MAAFQVKNSLQYSLRGKLLAQLMFPWQQQCFQQKGLMTRQISVIHGKSTKIAPCGLQSPKSFTTAGILNNVKVDQIMGRRRIHTHPGQEAMEANVACQVKVIDQGHKVELDLDGQKLKFHSVWLRQNCHCSSCKQAHSGQRLIRPAQLQPNYKVTQVQLKGDSLVVQCAEESDHVSLIPLNFLLDNEYSQEMRTQALLERTPEVLRGSIPDLEYTEVTESKQGLLQWVQHLNNYGVCILRNVPTELGTILEAVELIAPVQHTIYGQIFDVISTPKPINVAYSNASLDYHMDLVYYESPPGLQFLHCIRNDACVIGGESMLMDSFAAAEDLRKWHPEEFETLLRVPATFQKIHFDRDRPVYMQYKRPHIVISPEKVITAVNWAPAFEGPLNVTEEEVEPYYKAYTTFAKVIDTHDTEQKFRLEPGDLLGFNNRRILHSRCHFEPNGGVRHLQGCYLNIDEFKCQVSVLQHILGVQKPVKRIGNHCWM